MLWSHSRVNDFPASCCHRSRLGSSLRASTPGNGLASIRTKATPTRSRFKRQRAHRKEQQIIVVLHYGASVRVGRGGPRSGAFDAIHSEAVGSRPSAWFPD